jgi:hypothetical protein
MNLAGKIFAVASLVVAVFYAGITAALVSYQENYKQRFVDEEKAHEDTKVSLGNELADRKTLYDQLEHAHRRLKDEKGLVDAEVNQLRNEWTEAARLNKACLACIRDQEQEITNLLDRVERVNTDLKDQRAETDKLKAERDDWKAKHVELLGNRDKLQDLLTIKENDLSVGLKEIERLNSELGEATEIITRINDSYPDLVADARKRAPIVKEPKGGKVIRGKVTGVDKNLGLVIINAGQRHEVRKGYVFIVFRGDQYIGKVVVDEVFPDMSATHYSREDMKRDKDGTVIGVDVGDDVTTRLTIEL